MSARRINTETLSRYESLIDLLKAFDRDFDTLRVLVNAILGVMKGSYILTSPGLAIGSTTTHVANVAFSYIIDGVPYTKAAVAAGTAPGADVVPEGLYGAVAFDIDDEGTITANSAPANETGYATEALAIAALPELEEGSVRIGYITVLGEEGDFTIGTTALSAADTVVAYYNGQSIFEVLPAQLTAQRVASPK